MKFESFFRPCHEINISLSVIVYQVKPRSYTDLRHIGLMAFNSKVENYTVWKIINSGPPSALHDRDEGPLRWVVVKAPGATPWGAWGKSGEGKGGRGKGVCPSNFYRCPHFLIPGVAPDPIQSSSSSFITPEGSKISHKNTKIHKITHKYTHIYSKTIKTLKEHHIKEECETYR